MYSHIKNIMNSNLYVFAKKIIKFYMVWWIGLLWNIVIVYIVSDTLKKPLYDSYILIFIFNITVIFYLQKHHTFGNNNKSSLKQIIHYALLILVIIWCNAVIIPLINHGANDGSNRLYMLLISCSISIANFIYQNILFKQQ